MDSRGESELDYLKTEEGLKNFADENGFFDYCRVSAKTGTNVYDMFSKLIHEVYKLDMIRQAQIKEQKRKYRDHCSCNTCHMGDQHGFSCSNPPRTKKERKLVFHQE